jgi:hypothetical protein
MKGFNTPISTDGLKLEFSGEEQTAISVLVESGSTLIKVTHVDSFVEFVLPARRSYSTIALGTQLGLKSVEILPDPDNATPAPVVSYDIGVNPGVLTFGGVAGEIAQVDATNPGDGTWAAAPDAASVDEIELAFTAKGFTLYVQTASVEFRASFDGGTTFTGFIVLNPGIHSFDEWAATDLEIREDVDAGGGEYQLVAVT